METATLITLTFLVMFGALLIWLGVEQYFQYRKRTRHAH